MVTSRDATDENMEPLRADHPLQVLQVLQVLQNVAERESAELSATDWLAEELDYAGSLAKTGPEWDALIAADAERRYGAILDDRLGPDELARVRAEDPASLYRQLRQAEHDGHDPARVLAEAARGSLADADNINALLYWRIDKQVLPGRRPEAPPTGPSYAERTPPIAGPVGDHLRMMAELMDARRAELGERAAIEAPAWATNTLGPVPEDLAERLDWTQRAAEIAAYRERYQISDPADVLGPPPAAGMVEQHTDWRAAQDACGIDPATRRIAEASDAQLLAKVKTYEHEQAWAPTYVADQLREAHQAARDYERLAVLTAADAQLQTDPAERARAEELTRAQHDLAEGMAHRAAQLEIVHEAHQLWREETTQVRETAQAAQIELDRRTQLRPTRADSTESPGQVPAGADTVEAGRHPQGRTTVDQAADRELAPTVEHDDPGAKAVEKPKVAVEPGRKVSDREPAGGPKAKVGTDKPTPTKDGGLDLAAEVDKAQTAVAEVTARRAARAAAEAETSADRQAGYVAAERTRDAVDAARAASRQTQGPTMNIDRR